MVRATARRLASYALSAPDGTLVPNRPRMGRLAMRKPTAAKLLDALAQDDAPGSIRLPRTASAVTVALQQPFERTSGQYEFVKQALPRLAFNNPSLAWHVAYLPPTHDHVLRHRDGREVLVDHDTAQTQRAKDQEESAAPAPADDDDQVVVKKAAKPLVKLARKPAPDDTELLQKASITTPAIRITYSDGSAPRTIQLAGKTLQQILLGLQL